MTIPVNKVVKVTILTSPTFPARKGFGLLLIIGSTPGVLTQGSPIRFYSDIDGVAADYNSSTPEYQAAQTYFAQSPRPTEVAIGLSTAAPFSATNDPATIVAVDSGDVEQDIPTWQAVTAGTLSLTINGSFVTATGLDFSGATDLDGVAAIIQAAPAFGGLITVTQSVGLFTFTTVSVGASASISAPAAPLGSSIVEMLGVAGLSSTGVSAGPGTPISEALQTLQDYNQSWYGFTFVNGISDADVLEAAAWAEARIKIFGFTSADPNIANQSNLSNLALSLNALEYSRTFGVYDDNDLYAAVSVFGRAFTTNFNNQNSTITLKFKKLPGITPIVITETQRLTLTERNINYYSEFGDSAMLAEGVMVNGRFFDEVHGLDWLLNAIETNVFGYMYTAKTKIPQTDPGVARLVQQAEKACQEGVRNGLLAPGQYNGEPLGAVETGDFLAKGYYIFAQPIAEQNQSDREARKAPPIQGILKGAGALHFADIELNFER